VCTNEEPTDRPSAAHIVEALELDDQWSCSQWPQPEAWLVYVTVFFALICLCSSCDLQLLDYLKVAYFSTIFLQW
jgi:hypothetical protein